MNNLCVFLCVFLWGEGGRKILKVYTLQNVVSIKCVIHNGDSALPTGNPVKLSIMYS